jgi:nicotinamide mononucleotide transporter PnuC
MSMPLSVIFLAKGWVVAPIVGIVYSVLYAILAAYSRFYGEVIVLVVLIPINVATIISWLKNKDKSKESQVIVNKISKKEYLYLLLATGVLSVAMYYLLLILNTSEVMVSTIALLATLIATYLSYRRSAYYAVAYLIADGIRVGLWCISLFQGESMHLPTMLCFVMFIVSDIYGLIHWDREKNRQNDNLTN